MFYVTVFSLAEEHRFKGSITILNTTWRQTERSCQGKSMKSWHKKRLGKEWQDLLLLQDSVIEHADRIKLLPKSYDDELGTESDSTGENSWTVFFW